MNNPPTKSNQAAEYSPSPHDARGPERLNCKTGELKWTGTRVDLVFGSTHKLRWTPAAVSGGGEFGERMRREQ